MTSQLKEKRGAVSEKRRRQLFLLATEYQTLQQRFPVLRDFIQDDIDRCLSAAARTREADQHAVLSALEEWHPSGLTIEDLIDETGLSDRTVRTALGAMLESDPATIGVRDGAPDGDRGRRARSYFLLAAPK